MRISTSSSSAVTTTEDEPLIRGAKGDAVRDAQNQLLRAGFSLPRYGADGDYGRETATAVARFQKSHGLPETGAFDLATFTALENRPSPSPDYERLFKDHQLRAVIAIGHDEANSHEPENEKLITGLSHRGYEPVTADQRAAFNLDAEGTFLTKTLPQGTVILELLNSQTPDAKTRFAAALRRDELVLYGGHGRYGSGPDFDDINSPTGNFVIGAPYEAGHVTLAANDLQAAPLSAEYQLMFFDGCSTFRYFDELRVSKPTATLDVIGSNTELYWNVTAANLLAMLDGVSERQNLEQLETSLDAVNRASPADQRRFFRGDGFEDN